MGVTCQILIQRPREGVHRAGRPVVGSVKYAVDEPTEYKDIVISLVGEGECSWTESRRNIVVGSNHNRHNRHGHVEQHHDQRHKTYRGTEVFIANYTSILNKQPGCTAILPVGTYEYQFRYMLPKNIPPSFNDSICTITYQIGIKFEKPSLFKFHKKFTTAFNVYGYVEPVSLEGNTLFGLEKSLLRPFSKRKHMINLKANISSTLFAPGQNADIVFAVTNDSDVKITSIKTELVCYTTYFANCGRKKESKKFIKESTVETLSIPADAVANMASVMQVQADLYSIQNCRIIKNEYKLKVTLRLPIPYTNASMELPIVVGEKRNERNTEVAFFAGQVPGPSVQAVERLANGPPSYWEVTSGFDEKEARGNY